jgi:hypothetical protein
MASRKSILTILWNPHGFSVVTILPPGASFNASWFIDQNLVPLLDRFVSGERDPRQEKLDVPIHNASAYNARVARNFFEHNPTKRLTQPPHSPDIAPSSFYLFGKMKNALIGQEIPDWIVLLAAVTGIVSGFSGNELQAVFRN